MTQPKLAITIGDPAGIGTEIVLKALAKVSHDLASFTVIGDRSVITSTYQLLKKYDLQLADPDSLEILDTNTHLPITLGEGNQNSGEASFHYLDTAIAQTLTGKFQGIVTAPIAKSAWKLAGHYYAGQTELLSERSGSKDTGMLFVARSPHTNWVMRTLLATVHIPLAQVPKVLTPQLIEQKLELLRRSLCTDFQLTTAKVAISGLNPHSGEQGQLGTEEQEWLNPLIESIHQSWSDRNSKFELIGAIPPDTLWVNPNLAWHNPHKVHLGYDAYVALYHDQGLIPVKLLAFDQAVNTTIGLPFIRTSPDHGTAFDIAGKGIAKSDSLEAAITTAIELVQVRVVNNPN
ncbi:4-hydroxythreonine-4-phosphate dehydrogenase [Synechococcus sp. PCC 7502]|uniref:4-hydroxythreonine-4-phosphate dehydrogenase PdxA n=1 Tax=Synechococcus sp. PCC 7502 TaxID=1173263 RepID=UPI00029F8118|nr:4-hydroxythreonine-4-phosphate dehydrogenase PdxA [Synechococcus sp. PCC 7502]AFY72898.1 4-hydroxythreonine-4-phosphate dehydrogenase [Synechococcus sp. PCC 7502]